MLAKKDTVLEDLFKTLAESNSLASGYIFFGLAGDRPKVFAESLAHYLEGRAFAPSAEILQDTLIIDTGVGSVGIEEVRKIKTYLSEGSFGNKRRMVVIENADNLTLQAENALLKITEESPRDSLIILILKNTENLLPTLNSRFQKIYFSATSKDDFEEQVQKGNDDTIASRLIAGSFESRKKLIKEYLDNEEDPLRLVDDIILELFFAKKQTLPMIQRALRTRRELSSLNLNPRLQLESIFFN